MAGRTGFRLAGYLPKERLPPVDPEKARIGKVILLQGARLRLQEGRAGLLYFVRQLRWRGRAVVFRSAGTGGQKQQSSRGYPDHATVISWLSDQLSPAWSVQTNSSVPEVVAVV